MTSPTDDGTGAASDTQSAGTETFTIRYRGGAAVLFEVELPAELNASRPSIKLGAAIKLALKRGANLDGADLRGADLSRADLSGAKLGGADLRGADLREANLRGSDLGETNLSGANLYEADLRGADLGWVKGVIAAGQPDGWWTFSYREKDTGVLRVKVGCRDKTMAEARKYWSASHTNWSKRQEVAAALDLIEAIARLRGWEIAS